MFIPSPSTLLVLVLLAGANAAAQQPFPGCGLSPHQIELAAEPLGKIQEVCISLDLPTTFRFDSPLVPGSVRLQGIDRFEDVSLGTRSFTLLPSVNIHPGERFEVEVRFADEAAPSRAAFELVVHPAVGAQQVDVFRHKRTVEDYQREIQEERGKSQQLGQELDRLRLEQGPGGLTGLFASKLLNLDDEGVQAEDMSKRIRNVPGSDLRAGKVISYHCATRAAGMVRVAVAVMLVGPDVPYWTVKDAMLVDKDQNKKPITSVWQQSSVSLESKSQGVVMVELELTDQEARGDFTLKLWDESGTRLVSLENVTFP